MIGITLRQMEAFVAVARCGTVTRAGGEVHLSQPALSQAIFELETHLDERLFDRRGRRLHLNESGRALLPLALELVQRSREIEDAFRTNDSPLFGRVRIGASSTIGNYLIPGLVGRFVERYPGFGVSLGVANSETIVCDLLAFSVDIGFSEGGCLHNDIEASAWRRDTLAVFCSPAHPLARKRSVAPRELQQARWILREPGSGTRDAFERAIAGRLASIRSSMELGQSESVKRAVAAGLGIGCLSTLAIEREVRGKELRIIPTPFLDLERYFYLLVHRAKYRSRAFRELLAFCKGYASLG